MLCQKCGKNQATTHYTQIINGKKTEMHLCSQCAGSGNGTFPSLLSDMFFGETPYLGFDTGETVCPGCGSTLSRIRSQGKVGCGQCYDTFLDALLPYIRQIHGTDSHVRGVPAPESLSAETPENAGTEEAVLKKQLADAIAREDYEQAAVLRDKIKECKEGR